jgi:hypothetical protein
MTWVVYDFCAVMENMVKFLNIVFQERKKHLIGIQLF